VLLLFSVFLLFSFNSSIFVCLLFVVYFTAAGAWSIKNINLDQETKTTFWKFVPRWSDRTINPEPLLVRWAASDDLRMLYRVFARTRPGPTDLGSHILKKQFFSGSRQSWLRNAMLDFPTQVWSYKYCSKWNQSIEVHRVGLMSCSDSHIRAWRNSEKWPRK